MIKYYTNVLEHELEQCAVIMDQTLLPVQGSLVNLPVEVLLYIVSFLSTRDIARIRLVSKSLRSISEIPSLWEVFIWSHYAPRDDKLLKDLLRTFGKHIRRFYFTDDIAPSKLQLMLRMCKNVIQLSLPSFTYVANFDKFEMTVCKLGSLQILVIPSPMYRNDFQRILKLSSNLKELSLHCCQLRCQSIWWFRIQMKEKLEEWENCNYLPRKLSIIIMDKPLLMHSLISSLQSCFSTLRDEKLPSISNAPNIAWLNICFNMTENFSSILPYIQVRITDSSVALHSVKASKYGLLGLDLDTLHLTQGNYHGKQVHKALLIGGNDEYIDTSVTSLTSVTYFDASCCSSLYPGHLEQLSVACPNLQRLDLCGNSECLNNLQGLHSLANNCKSLQALNLLSILVSDREYDCLQLWEILCIMKLTQLVIEAWMISAYDSRNSNSPPLSSRDSSIATKRQKLIDIFQKYLSLQVLEVDIVVKRISCSSFNSISDNELSLVSHFPSVTSYRLCNLPNNNCYHTLKRIFGCKYLRCLFLSKSIPAILSLFLEGHCSSLQQLYIYSRDTVLTKTFIDALCDHGGLEHVILCVKSLTAGSISDIIEHSYDLVTFDITLCSRVFTKAQQKQLIAALKIKFSKRKLFNGGSFAIRQVAYDSAEAYVNDNSLLHKTDLLSVWDSNEIMHV